MTLRLTFWQKMVVPSDTRKKNLTNCGIALQYLRQAGLKLYDQDGTEIIEDDVANGDKELVLSLLWNMFVHLQVKFVFSLSQILKTAVLNGNNFKIYFVIEPADTPSDKQINIQRGNLQNQRNQGGMPETG